MVSNISPFGAFLSSLTQLTLRRSPGALPSTRTEGDGLCPAPDGRRDLSQRVPVLPWSTPHEGPRSAHSHPGRLLPRRSVHALGHHQGDRHGRSRRASSQRKSSISECPHRSQHSGDEADMPGWPHPWSDVFDRLPGPEGCTNSILPLTSHDAAQWKDGLVALSFLYRLAVGLLDVMRLSCRSDTDKDIEILVLRHQIRVPPPPGRPPEIRGGRPGAAVPAGPPPAPGTVVSLPRHAGHGVALAP
jgi:hypothetical protein